MKKSKQQLQTELEKLSAEKEKLVAAKASLPEKWTEKAQEKLDKVVEDIVDLEEQIELAQEDETATVSEEKASEAYTPEEGTEEFVHLLLVKGRRFNPKTGKEESTPYKQLFTHGEFQLFKENYVRLGYSVIQVLHDPYGEAETLLEKEV
jgi:hypothetical protein